MRDVASDGSIINVVCEFSDGRTGPALPGLSRYRVSKVDTVVVAVTTLVGLVVAELDGERHRRCVLRVRVSFGW